MNHLQQINSFSELMAISLQAEKPLIISLEVEHYGSLMCEVVEGLLAESNDAFRFVKVRGAIAMQIQKELNILYLPAILLLHAAEIKVIFQGLVAKHEILTALASIH